MAGRGEIAGMRVLYTLPGRGDYFHSLSTGIDFKRFNENLSVDEDSFVTPVEYWPMTFAYGGGWVGDESFTEVNASATWAFRGLGSGTDEFDTKRFGADGSFFYFRGDLARTQDLPKGFEAFGKLQAQATTNRSSTTSSFPAAVPPPCGDTASPRPSATVGGSSPVKCAPPRSSRAPRRTRTAS